MALCPPVGRKRIVADAQPARCTPPAPSPHPPPPHAAAALRPTRRLLCGAVQSRQVQRRRLLPNRGHNRGGLHNAVHAAAAAAPQTARPLPGLGLTGPAGGGARGAPPLLVTCLPGRLRGCRLCVPKRLRPLKVRGAQVKSTSSGAVFGVLLGTSPRLDPLSLKGSLGALTLSRASLL